MLWKSTEEFPLLWICSGHLFIHSDCYATTY